MSKPARPSGSPTRPVGGGGDTRELLAEIDRLRAALAQATTEAEALRDQVALLQPRLDQAEADRQAALQTLSQAQDEQRAAGQVVADSQQELTELRAALARLGAEGQGAVPLLEVFRQRGLLGVSEAQQLVLALAQERALAPVLELLSTARPEALERFLASRVLLVGSCPACPRLPGRVHLELPAERCEFCRGGDLRKAVRRFYDGALITGLTRLVLVGGAARDHLVLREMLDDRRVELILVHGGLRKAAEEVATDLEHARAVVLWEHPASEAAVLQAYDGFAGPRVRVAAGDLASFLEAAGSGLGTAFD